MEANWLVYISPFPLTTPGTAKGVRTVQQYSNTLSTFSQVPPMKNSILPGIVSTRRPELDF